MSAPLTPDEQLGTYWEQYRAHFVALLRRLLPAGHGDTAEDLYQEVYLRLRAGLAELEWRGDGAAFRLFEAVTRRTAIDWWREATRQKRDVFRTTSGDGGGLAEGAFAGVPKMQTPPSGRLRAAEQKAMLEAAAAALLPDPVREILRLRFAEELSYQDIAARTGFSEARLRQVICRALVSLRDHLRASEFLTPS